MRQMISFSPVLQACLVEADFAVHTISTTTVWTPSNTPNNGDFLIEDELVVEGGATLTIGTGVTVRFGEQGRVVIKPNAVLNLQGTLTGMGCGITWKGVETWGNSAQSQFSVGGVRAQGWFIGGNGGVIENAETGVKLYGPSYTNNAGGLISSNGAIFRNCIIGVEFAPYQNFWPYFFPPGQQGQPRNYSATLSRCTFVVDDDYPHSTSFISFVHMRGVNGINLMGNTYTNAMSLEGEDDYISWGYGIFANDAGFHVGAAPNGNTAPPSSYTRSEFNNLAYGIHTAMIINNRPYQVRQSDFNNCFVGLRNKGVSGGTILFNNFNLGELPSMDFVQEQAGISFEIGISGFTCQENEFEQIGMTQGLTTIGIFSDNTGDFNKTIRKNYFTGLSVGNLANGQNGANPSVNPEIIRGLNYLCNQNFNVWEYGADFNVESGWVRNRQGLPDLTSFSWHRAAGNRFSYTGTDFNNSGTGNITYFYGPFGVNQTPLTYSGLFIPVPENPNACISEYCEPPCKEVSELEAIKSEYYVRKNSLLLAQADYQANPTEGKMLEMAGHRQAMDDAAYMIVIHQLYDTTAYHLDTLLAWVGNMNSVDAELWLAREYFASGDTSTALQLLDNIPVKYNLSSEEQSDILNFRSITNLLAGQAVYNLNQATLAAIKNYDQAGGNAGGWAQNMLTMYGAHYPPKYEFSPIIRERSLGEKATEPDDTRKASVNWLVVQPNPAQAYVHFHLQKPVENQNSLLLIRDLSGRAIQTFSIPEGISSTTWNTGNNPPGIYFYQLLSNGLSLQTGKIIINK